MCAITVLTFFECRYNSNDLNARLDSRSHLVLMIFEIVIILFYSLLVTSDLNYVLIVV